MTQPKKPTRFGSALTHVLYRAHDALSPVEQVSPNDCPYAYEQHQCDPDTQQ